MKHFKTNKFTHMLVAAGLMFSACDNSLMQVDPVLESNLLAEDGMLNTLQMTEVTDFSNLREGDYTGRFLILTRSNNLPANLERSIREAGGEIVQTYPQVGVAVAIAHSPDFLIRARNISNIESVTPDFILKYSDEPTFEAIESLEGNSGSEANSASARTAFNWRGAFFDGFQWAPQSIEATKAWDAGFTGAGVRVAVLDGGFHANHIDISPNLDRAGSRSTVPGFAFNQDVGTFWHGTHVAGIVGASGIGMVGIAPRATIVGVKVLHNGSGAFEWILNGILYAATPREQGGGGAQIINMSLGATIDYRNNWGSKEFRDAFRELQKIYDRATRFAWQNGVTVIASAGNGATNYDDAKELFKLPAQNQHVLSISSTGPTGWLLGNNNFSQPSYFTDFGKSLVSFAAPGGSIGLSVVQGINVACTLRGTFTSSTNNCAAFDQVFSTIRGTSNGNYGWAQGTSMAAPAAAGVVALMMEANGGNMTPAQVRSRMMQTATDLGKPGNDEFYGMGFVNAARAVGIN